MTDEMLEVPDGVAVIGMAGRFPGAQTIEDFWQNIRAGVESVSFFTDEELLAAGVDPALLQQPQYVKAAAVLDDIDVFDAAFFGITPREAESMDPQHRLFLEWAWEAFEHAGYNVELYQQPVAVYAGMSESAYLVNLYTNPDFVAQVGQYQIGIGNGPDALTSRVAYKLNLKGPAITVQTACSSALVAVHLACQSLLTYQCDMVLAGGVSISIPQKAGYVYQEGHIFSPDGHCRAFDAQAQGTIFGSGGGIVLLKRLQDALDDGDTIYATIRGSAINNDGAAKIGYTAPSVAAQAAVIVEAQTLAQVDPATISYIEAHGTGTPLGDPIEIAALTQAFRTATQASGFCALGSVKTNIGHLDHAAGIAGLLKTILALKHQELVPSLHFTRPNPQIDFTETPFYVQTTLTPWPATSVPRRAGVSSFGIGGTNAHLVLEEPPLVPPTSAPAHSQYLLLLSARTPVALAAMATRLKIHLQQHPEQELADIAYTLQVGRKVFAQRWMQVCRDRTEALAALDMVEAAGTGEAQRLVAFLFPGQGAQHVHMAAELYQQEATFREWVDHCAQLLQPQLGLDLRELLYPCSEEAEATQLRLQNTAIAQPALFVIEYALARLWMSWGVQPSAMLGHSLGEYVAACLAEVFSLEDALLLVAERGRLMQTCAPGLMLTVPLGEQEVKAYLGSRLALAALNGPKQCVVAGPTEDMRDLQTRLAARGLVCQQLHTSHAFHSSLMEPMLAAFHKVVQRVSLHAPQLPYLSNLSGTWATAEEVTNPDYWVRHVRQTVHFAGGLAELLHNCELVLLEVGPGQTLRGLVRQQASTQDQLVYSSLRHPRQQQSDLACLLHALGCLWLAGVPVAWSHVASHERRQRVPLPTYPFERERYWIEARTLHLQAEVVLPQVAHAVKPAPLPITHARPAIQHPYVAPTNALEHTLCTLWQQVLGIELVGIDDDYFALGGDSLQATHLVAHMRTHGQVEVSLRLLFDHPTVARLAQALSAIQQDEPPNALARETSYTLEADAVLDATIQVHDALPACMVEPAHIFLTGATGFVGAFLLHELLITTQAEIYCLVRASDVVEGKKRLRENLATYLLWDERFTSRLIPVLGDLAQPLLGLPAAQFDLLATTIDVIYHSGAWVNFIYPYHLLKAANVLGTQEVLRLACHTKIKPVHYTSSIAVFELGNYADGVTLSEDRLPDPGAEASSTGYAQSKWVAERLMLLARARGLPVTLYRLGNVAGHSKTGACNLDDFLYRMMLGCLQLGSAPAIDTLIDITPVDYAVKALVYLSRQNTAPGKNFHLVNPWPTRWEQLVAWTDSLGYTLPSVPYNRWRTALMQTTSQASDNALQPLLSFFAAASSSEQEMTVQLSTPTYGCQQTLEGLRGSFIICPSIDAELLSVYLAYLVHHQLLHNPF